MRKKIYLDAYFPHRIQALKGHLEKLYLGTPCEFELHFSQKNFKTIEKIFDEIIAINGLKEVGFSYYINDLPYMKADYQEQSISKHW